MSNELRLVVKYHCITTNRRNPELRVVVNYSTVTTNRSNNHCILLRLVVPVLLRLVVIKVDSTTSRSECILSNTNRSKCI